MIRQSSEPCDLICRSGGEPCAKCAPENYYAVTVRGGTVGGLFRLQSAAEDHARAEARFGDEFQMVRVLAWEASVGAYANTVFACRLEQGSVKEYRP